MSWLLAQAEVTSPSGGGVAAFILVTLALIAGSGAVLWKVRSYEAKLILLGLMAAVAAIGYGSMIDTPSAGPMGLAFMRIAVILVLCGVACSLLAYLGAPGRGQAGEVLTPPREDQPR
jgi:hypothetical protein